MLEVLDVLEVLKGTALEHLEHPANYYLDLRGLMR